MTYKSCNSLPSVLLHAEPKHGEMQHIYSSYWHKQTQNTVQSYLHITNIFCLQSLNKESKTEINR
jgi:hypothetical protein